MKNVLFNKSNGNVESVETVKRLIRRGMEKFSANRLIIDPDCGLRTLPRDIAKKKLRVMVEATEEIRKEKGLA